TLKTIFIALFILAFFVSCGNTLGPGDLVSDYVELSSSGIDPDFIFLKESGESTIYEYSNIEYNVFADMVSFDLLVTFGNGHTYNIRCSNIERSYVNSNVRSYKVEITVRWGNETISETLFYPGDAVFIKSVDPSAGLVHNVSTDFTVIVEYSLVSFDEGYIDIAFNEGDHPSEDTFNVTATPKDWGEEGDFTVIVDLEHEGLSQSLYTDEEVLLFE
ncbi:MAG: hypothetical protein P8Y30_04345, partial [candidate division WOR-3 bacterium]